MAGRILWLLGNLVLLAAALSHSSDVGTILGRYSTSYALALAVAFATVIGAAFVSLTRSGRKMLERAAARYNGWIARRGAWAVVVPALMLLAALTLLFWLPTDIQYIELLLLFNILLLLIAAARSVADGTPANVPVNRLLWVVLIAILAFALFSAHAVPPEQGHGDEAAWANMAHTLRTTGQAYIRISGHAIQPIPPGVGWWVAPYAVWQGLFGPGMASGRVFIWGLYLAAVACIGLAGARLYDRTTGLIAALLSAASLFMLTYRIIRPDIGLAAVGGLLFVLYLASRKRPLWAFAAGWVAVLGLEIHAASLAYIVAMILMFATDALPAIWQRRNPFERRQFALVAGMACGIMLYLALHVLILPDPASFFTTLRANRGFLRGLPDLELLTKVFQTFWVRSPLEVLLVLLGLWVLVVRRAPGDRVVLRFFAFTLLSHLLFVPVADGYLVLFMPFMALAMARLLTFADHPTPAPFRRTYSLLAAAAFCAPFIALALPGLSLNPIPPTELTPVMQRARELSTPDEVVVGDGFTWWGLTDYEHFYAFWSEFELTIGLGFDTPRDLYAGLDPQLVFYVYRPGFPNMPTGMLAYVNEAGFELVDSFVWENLPVEFYRRPENQS